jgi:hypothetical protein
MPSYQNKVNQWKSVLLTVQEEARAAAARLREEHERHLNETQKSDEFLTKLKKILASLGHESEYMGSAKGKASESLSQGDVLEIVGNLVNMPSALSLLDGDMQPTLEAIGDLHQSRTGQPLSMPTSDPTGRTASVPRRPVTPESPSRGRKEKKDIKTSGLKRPVSPKSPSEAKKKADHKSSPAA